MPISFFTFLPICFYNHELVTNLNFVTIKISKLDDVFQHNASFKVT